MNILELVQLLHYEAKQPGTEPQTTIGQSGRTGDFVRWIIQAYIDLQLEEDGQWKWLKRDWFVLTTQGQNFYAPADCQDTLLAAPIDRFRAWFLDEEDPPYSYSTLPEPNGGPGTTRELIIYDQFSDFRRRYLKRPDPESLPAIISRDNQNTLYLGPTPDGEYRVSGQYWRGPQVLVANDTDVPEMPSEFHPLIVYRAMTKYAYNIVAQEILARAVADGTAMYDSLVANQWDGRDRLRWPAAHA